MFRVGNTLRLCNWIPSNGCNQSKYFHHILTFPRVNLCIPYIANVGMDIATVMIIADAKKNLTSLSVQKEHSKKMASGAIVDTAFPVVSLVPKIETGVLNFIQKYPDFDGRNVVIAVFDSGVDPRACGLQTICDGSVKVIERFDCSGCGDTDVSKKVTADAKGCIIGLSGRLLKLTPQMVAANTRNGEYGVGLKGVSDLYPSKIREVAVSNRKLKEWDKPHKTATADVVRQISEFDVQNSDATKLSWEKKLEKENLDNALEFLNIYEKLYSDIKTTYDIVVYPTENGWRVAIDTTMKGDLENAVHIGEYNKTHEIKNLDEFLSVSMNVHEEGNLVEIVGMCSSHGTHVASIASGNHESKDVNGVAPNAKIVSLTIGDGRLGSMETGTSLVRAMIKVMELCESGKKIDVINMSYGEHAAWSNCGRIGELMSEVVNKYGVVWVASAGNHGPALSTIGVPPDISQPSCIGVGAYISPQMMEAEYTLREKLPGNVYTWTSRDPCIDGGQGITVCAPGAAITSVPQFTMCKSQLMNGTSMAAPHVAGAIALLISGLKAKGIAYSPFSIKRAISVTATKLNYVDPFAQGNGLLNVEKAFDHLLEYKNAPENLLRFFVRALNSKGIHLREGFLKKPYEYVFNVGPTFLNDKEVDPKDKINFNVRLNLVPSHPFVQCGSFLDLCYGARTFTVKVDPTGLPPGVHRAVVNAYDSSAVEKGSVFDIPITVIQPHVLNIEQTRVFEPPAPIEFQPNTIQRDFILVPNNATWAVLKMRSTDANRDKEVGKFFIHTMQLLPTSSCRKLETMKILNVTSEAETIWPFKVQANNILELCLAKYWANFGNTHVKYSLEFHGIVTSPKATIMHPAQGIHRFHVTALSSEDFQPSIQLKTAAVVLKPTETKITPLSPTRDVIPAGRQIYQNVLTYNLNVSKAQEISLYAPLFNPLLYESEFESQLWMLFDTNKMLIACGDARSHTFCTKLEKGEYTVRLQIRHEKKDALEKISEATMVALFKLSSPLSLDIYDHYNQCIVAGRKFASCLVKHVPKVVYVAPLNNEKITKAGLPNGTAWLNGILSLAKDEIGRRVHVLKFQYFLGDGGGSALNKRTNGAVSPTAAISDNGNGNGRGNGECNDGGNNGGDGSPGKSTSSASSPKKTAKTRKDDYAKALRDFQCSMIAKLDLDQAEELCSSIIASRPKHTTAILKYIQNIESTNLKPQLPFTYAKSIKADEAEAKSDVASITSTLVSIIEKTNIVIKDTDKDGLLSYYGIKNDTRPDAAKIKIKMEKQKCNLLEALSKKGIAIVKLNVIENGSQNAKRLEEIDGIFTEIGKFTDATDTKIATFTLWHAYAHSHYGRMVKILQKLYEEKLNKEIYDELALVTAANKWNHITEAIELLSVSANPMGYRLF